MKEALTRKAGPLPVWGWIVVIALVVVGYAWWKGQRNQQAANAAATPADVAPPTIYQFQTTPPVQEDEDTEEDKEPKPPKRHQPRKHPTDHDKDKDDRKRRPAVKRGPAGPRRPAPRSGDPRIGVR